MAIDWDEMYDAAEEITDVPWEQGTPNPELERLIKEGKLKPCKALDVGCGFGTHAIFLAQKKFDVTALDISEKALKVAKQRADDANTLVRFIKADVLEKILPDTYGLIFDRGCFHSLDPEQWDAYLSKIHTMLDPLGKFYLEVFSDTNPPGEGPFRFAREELVSLLSRYFKVLDIREIVHIEGKPREGNKAYLYSVFMERK